MKTYTISGYMTIPFVHTVSVDDDVNMNIDDDFVKDNLTTMIKKNINMDDHIPHILDLQIMDIDQT